MAGAAGLAGALGGQGLAALAAGLTVGIVGGSALVATGAVSFDRGGGTTGQSDTAVLVVYPCPDQGPPLGTIRRGQQVLVTGRSPDGSWLEIYYPGPFARAWLNGGLEVEGDIRSLPVHECEKPAGPTARPTAEPTASPTPEPTASPTPEPTPSPTPSPTAVASPTPNTAPKVSGLTASRATISYDTGDYCPSSPASVTISVGATDADGIASVSLYFRRPGTSTYLSKPMVLSGGKWTATLDTKADGIKTAGKLAYYVVAKDKNASPKTTKSPKSGALYLTVNVCRNTGPTITSRVANPTTIGTGPDTCGYVMNSQITVKATDQDGVKSLTLYFKGPGQSTWTKRALALEGAATSVTGFGEIDPGDEGITRSGTISWYVVATDEKGAKTTSSKKSITVRRCDREASYGSSDWSGPLNVGGSCGLPKAYLLIELFDADSSVGSLKTRFYWSLYLATGYSLDSGSVSGIYYGKEDWYEAVIPSESGWVTPLREAKGGYLRITKIVTTDHYGEITTLSKPDISSLPVNPCYR